ncbi:MAG TPA: AAA family ATPase [Hyphomicrobiaceae bacterium]|nr:AAA family ATPase [Hyphomicrobiaceae bacterium]
MHINRLRLVGFKSFVEPTELLIEKGLTGVVGPNGCGKSNLLEALRWVMGETSHSSMRAAAMDDVIFSGSADRPPRETAEVTIFLDNTDRKAPTEFNGDDSLDVTRRIEREAGSAYRINGREVRARDVRILFEDAATGARSPALVRQGQIGEIVNAKPEKRRRILEDAAGVAGLHSRRHEAELRLKAAEANLARLNDVLGQLDSQIESLKRQARQARRYKELSADIRRLDAVVLYLRWQEAQGQVDADEAGLAAAQEKLAQAVQAEAKAVTAEAEAAEQIQPLREQEAAKGAVLQRFKVEHENLEREAKRTAERLRELEGRVAQVDRDRAREESLIEEARETLARLEAEAMSLQATEKRAAEFEQKALAAYDASEDALNTAEARLSEVTTAVAQARAHRQSLDGQLRERQERASKLERQLVAFETQTREIVGRAPDAAKLKAATEVGQQLMADIAAIEEKTVAAEETAQAAAAQAKASSDAAAQASLAAGQIKTEMETLSKLLKPADESGIPPVLDQVKVASGFELALAAAIGDDLDVPVATEGPARWTLNPGGEIDPALPRTIEPLAAHVVAPEELARRLKQIGVVAQADGPRLQRFLRPGQRLVSVEGDLWRWDGFVASAQGALAAASRLRERGRLGLLMEQEKAQRQAAEEARAAAEAAAEAHRKAQTEERQLRQQWRDCQARLAETREALTAMERQARETEAKLAGVADARERTQETLVEAHEQLAETEAAVKSLAGTEKLDSELRAAQEQAGELRKRVTEAKTELITLEREHRTRSERLAAITTESERWTQRSAGARQQLDTLESRTAEAKSEIERLAGLPDMVEERRQKLLAELSKAEAERQAAADAAAAAQTAHREAAQALRQAQSAVSDERERRARIEARLEGARQRRAEELRKIREAMACDPEGLMAAAQLPEGTELPQLADADRELAKLKADRERLGGVNLQADEDLARIAGEHEGMFNDKADVEAAVAKLRGAIKDINDEGENRLNAAFDAVDAHFQRLFAVLFGGGEAKLEMIAAEDPLEVGLEIVAKPPGKKPSTLSLLSGGEQTLTALALIFAVFLTNPSPICVLDEVDAPLDDSNVDRMCTMLEKMAADTDTRFLVITHHPMTMSRMSRLFGVTMAEKGVSQLVSVDLETAQKFTEAA